MADILKEGQTIINGILFTPVAGINYKHNYVAFSQIIKDPSRWEEALRPTGPLTEADVEKAIYRYLILNDLWFILTFVLETPLTNRKFIVDACREVEDNGSWNLNLWARFHFKSSIRKARNIQRLLSRNLRPD